MNKNLVQIMYKKHYIPEKYWNYSFSDFLILPMYNEFYQEITHKIQTYIDKQLNTKGFGILLTGPFRSGKTTLAVAIAKYFMKVNKVMPYFISNYLLYSIYFGKEDISFNDLIQHDFIILDDIGREHKNKDFAGNVLEDFLRERINRNLGTVITTNLTMGEIKETYGTAFYSLINEMFCLQISMKEIRDGFVKLNKNIYQKEGGVL